jgi:PAS domain S-box-containing protein
MASKGDFPRGNGEPVRASVLLVDDNLANLTALESILEPLGHRLVYARSGEEALKALLREEFAVILMDVQMPGLDGYATAAMIKERERTRHVPLIFLTAIHKEPDHVFLGYARGAVDYVLKPVDPDILRTKVAAFVELYVRGERLRQQEILLHQRERQLLEQRSRLRYHNLTHSLPQCVLAMHGDGRVYYCNQRWIEYTRLQLEETCDDAGMRAVHPDDREALAAAWQEALRTGSPLEQEYRLRSGADQRHRWHLGRALAERDENGEVIGWIWTATDIDELKEAREQTEAASRLKDEFLATISHELRNPLSAMIGWTRMLRHGELTPSQVEHALETIERNAEVQLSLIEDLLDTAGIVRGQLRVELRQLQLDEVLGAALEVVRPSAEAKGVYLEYDLDAAAGIEVLGDADRLQQVVWNLLSNAIRFTPRDGLVVVEVESYEESVHILVRDTGAGIPADFLPRVFDRFSQANGTITRSHRGLGLGLAIVRHLVELHGGRVHATSPGEGKGSVFVVELPRQPPGALVSVASSAPAAPVERPRERPALAGLPRLDGVHVLVVDDEEDLRDMLRALLELQGATVTVAGSAQEGLQAFRDRRPDILLSDIGMPEQDGYAMIREVRQLEGGEEVPAIALTGFARTEDSEQALASGFQGHLCKPVEPAALIDVVVRYTGQPAGSRPGGGLQQPAAS